MWRENLKMLIDLSLISKGAFYVSVHKHKRVSRARLKKAQKSAKLGLAANEKSFLIFRLIFACAAKEMGEPQLYIELKDPKHREQVYIKVDFENDLLGFNSS